MPFYEAVIKVFCCPILSGASEIEILDKPKLKAGGDFVREMVRFMRKKGLH